MNIAQEKTERARGFLTENCENLNSQLYNMGNTISMLESMMDELIDTEKHPIKSGEDKVKSVTICHKYSHFNSTLEEFNQRLSSISQQLAKAI